MRLAPLYVSICISCEKKRKSSRWSHDLIPPCTPCTHPRTHSFPNRHQRQYTSHGMTSVVPDRELTQSQRLFSELSLGGQNLFFWVSSRGPLCPSSPLIPLPNSRLTDDQKAPPAPRQYPSLRLSATIEQTEKRAHLELASRKCNADH